MATNLQHFCAHVTQLQRDQNSLRPACIKPDKIVTACILIEIYNVKISAAGDK